MEPSSTFSRLTILHKSNSRSRSLILANNINLNFKDTRLAFYFDGSLNPVDQFHHTPSLTTSDFMYDELVFKSDLLPEGEHTLLVSNWADGDSGSLVLFDYAIYT